MIKNFFNELRGDRFNIYRVDVLARNYDKIQKFILIGLILGISDVVGEFLLNDAAIFFTAVFVLLIYFIVLFAIMKFSLSNSSKHITLIFYLMEIPLMVMAIVMGTFLDPHNQAILILVFICVLPMFILDKPWRIDLYITVVSLAYAICSYLTKDPGVFLPDMINLFPCWLISLSVNTFIEFERIESVEASVRNREKAEHDDLTNIFNRGGGDERISELMSTKTKGAFIILDIDDFKKVNDTYGHAFGDEVLIRLSNTLSEHFRITDVVMRLGGDEFAIFARGLTNKEMCMEKLSGLLEAVKEMKFAEASELRITTSMGCTIYLGDDTVYEDIYRLADSYLYDAKKSGKDRVVIK